MGSATNVVSVLRDVFCVLYSKGELPGMVLQSQLSLAPRLDQAPSSPKPQGARANLAGNHEL